MRAARSVPRPARSARTRHEPAASRRRAHYTAAARPGGPCAMAVIEAFVLFVLALFGAPAFGVPPLPEDPALMRVAPRDALLHVVWFGRRDADAASANATEQLVAEPQLRRLGDRVVAALRAGCARAAEGHAGDVDDLFDLVLRALQRP